MVDREDNGGEEVVTEALIWNADGKSSVAKSILVGKLMTDKNLNQATIISMVRKAWNLQEGLDVVIAGKNSFLFKFDSIEESNRIMRGKPWSILGQLLNVQERPQFRVFEELNFVFSPIWIQLQNLPLEAMNVSNAIILGSRVGEVVMVEDPMINGRLLRCFLRMRVVLDLRKPLVSGFWIPRLDGSRIRIAIKYEKLQDFCYKCGCIGHEPRGCKEVRKSLNNEGNEAMYGAWLSTMPVRNWEEALVTLKCGWPEATQIKRGKSHEEGKRGCSEVKREYDEARMNYQRRTYNRGKGKQGMEETLGSCTMEEGANFDDLGLGSDLGQNSRWATGGSKRMIGQLLNGPEMNTALEIGPMEKRPVLANCETSYGGEEFSSPATDRVVCEETNELAIVPYMERKALKDVTEKLGGVQLKREADGVLEGRQEKRHKIHVEPVSFKAKVTVFAEGLKSEKTKATREKNKRVTSIKKEARSGKMRKGGVVDKQLQAMKSDSGSDEVKVDRMVDTTTEGVGGWPVTATKV